MLLSGKTLLGYRLIYKPHYCRVRIPGGQEQTETTMTELNFAKGQSSEVTRVVNMDESASGGHGGQH